MSVNSLRDPYGEFLRSADVATWRKCATQAMRRAATLDGEERIRALADGLCITQYLEWLARISGDSAVLAEARKQHVALIATLEDQRSANSGAGVDLCWSLALAWQGFRAQARDLRARAGPISVEHALLVLGDDDVETIATLRPLVGSPGATGFLPALYVFGNALVNLGSIREARDLMDRSDWSPGEPLLLELMGSAYERLGQWAAARDVYASSNWPLHRLRAAVVGAVAASRDAASQADSLQLDEFMLRLMSEEGGELDQSKIIRSIAFLNACQWRPVDSWVVEFELGKLSFARRRYAEADLHLRRAQKSVPEVAQFVVALKRWVNLTWLTGNDASLGELNMVPEALTAAWGALAVSSQEAEVADILIWLARTTNDLALISGQLGTMDMRQRASAHDAMGDRDLAVDCWLDCLRTGYDHRVVSNLAEAFLLAGFESTTSFLAQLVLRESENDFFAIWETSSQLDPEVRGRLRIHSAAAGPLHEFTMRDRLVELSRLDFKNSLRAYELLSRFGEHDIAEQLLRLAARQAEGAAELLAVARCRRPAVRGFGSDEVDEGLQCLARALKEARDSQDRLLIARELFAYGMVRDGLEVLNGDDVFGPGASLTHIEMIAVLECGRWLLPAQLSALATRAVDRLVVEHQSGMLGASASAYGRRLITTLSKVDPALAERVRRQLGGDLTAEKPPTQRSGPARGVAAKSEDRAESRSELDGDAGPGGTVPGEAHGSTGVGTSFGQRLMEATRLCSRLTELQTQVLQVNPDVQDDETPILRDGTGLGQRTVELCDLFRIRLSAADSAVEQLATVSLTDFYRREDQLVESWEQARRDTQAPIKHEIVEVATEFLDCLGKLVSEQELAYNHPVLREVFRHVREDAAALAVDSRRKLETAARELDKVRGS